MGDGILPSGGGMSWLRRQEDTSTILQQIPIPINEDQEHDKGTPRSSRKIIPIHLDEEGGCFLAGKLTSNIEQWNRVNVSAIALTSTVDNATFTMNTGSSK